LNKKKREGGRERLVRNAGKGGREGRRDEKESGEHESGEHESGGEERRVD
jgi:hypothetical protein